MKTRSVAVQRAEMTILFSVLLLAVGLPPALGQFNITYYDNYDNSTQSWDYWEVGDTLRFWDEEYLADFTSGNTEPSAHYRSSIEVFDLRTGFGSLDTHVVPISFTDDDWTPLKSIGDPAWYGEASPHHVYAAKFEGMVYFEEGDVLSLESDDDGYIFLDGDTAWGHQILSCPGMHPFPEIPPSVVIPAELAGFHTMTVKFADTHEVQSGIRITVNGTPLRAVLGATVEIKPETLNLSSPGAFTAFIRLVGGRDVADIDISTMECAGAPAANAILADDMLIVKFNRQDLESVTPGDEVTLTVTGQLTGGRRFTGTDVIRVINQGADPKTHKKR